MKHHTYQKWIAAGSALLVLLSLTGCGLQSAAQTPVLEVTEAPQAEMAEMPQETMPETENTKISTDTHAEDKKIEETSTGTHAEEKKMEETSTDAPALEQLPAEAPAQIPEKVPEKTQPARQPQPDQEEEPLPNQDPYNPDIDVPDERPTFEGMEFVFADEWAKAQYEDARYPDMQTTKPNTGNTTLDHWLSLVLEHHELTLEVGETYQMAYSFFGSDELRWYSEDESILTVDQTGRITALAEGKTDVVVVSGECGARDCEVTVIKEHPPVLTKDEQARAVAKEIADIIMNDPTITTDIERIAYAARFVNVYVDMGHTSSIHEDCRTAYGTFVAGYSNCVGSTKATGLVLEYMGFSWHHVNKGQWGHQWCEVYDVDGQTAFCDGSVYGIVGFGQRHEDGSNWLYMTNEGQLVSFNEYFN